MRRAGDRIFIDSDPRPEPTCDEIEPSSRRRHRDAAHVEARQSDEVRLQGRKPRWVIDHHDVVIGTLQASRTGQAQGLQQACGHIHRQRLLGRKVHRQQTLGAAADPQFTAAGVEAQHLSLLAQLLEQHPGRRQGGVAAQINFDRRGEPAQGLAFTVANEVCSFGQIVFFGDTLQQRIG